MSVSDLHISTIELLEVVFKQGKYRVEKSLILGRFDQFLVACYISTPVDYKPTVAKEHKRPATHGNIGKCTHVPGIEKGQFVICAFNCQFCILCSQF